MNLQQRIELLAKLGNYLVENNEALQDAKHNAYLANPWFVPEFIDKSCENIATRFLNKHLLENWAGSYFLKDNMLHKCNIGIIMAGNIPLVGFHDFLCVFISGHRQTIKASSKDDILIKFLVAQLALWDQEVLEMVSFADNLKGCDAYIATGSNNSSRYFEYYFQKYPHIIRKNRTGVAILTAKESIEELNAFTSDLMSYFGFGCRNVTQLYVPENYDFIPLIESLKKYAYYLDFHKYRHNYDYQLAVLLLNSKYYMDSGSLLFSESDALFSPISQVHYSYYKDENALIQQIKDDERIQCIIGHNFIPFGNSQIPDLSDYADGVDTMKFINSLTDLKK